MYGVVYLKNTRIQELKKLFLNKKQLLNKELCDLFGVSIETIRRDLNILEQENFIQKVYGGARLVENTSIPDNIEAWDTRRKKNEMFKKSIAERVAELIPDGCTVFLDTGTSVFEVLPLLQEKKNLTVLTNSLRVATELALCDSFSVYNIGGLVKRETLTSVGLFAKEFLASFYRIDFAVLSCDGFVPERGTTEYSREIAEFKQLIIDKTAHIIAVADHTKFGIAGSCFCCPTEKIGTLVTDSLAGAPAVSYLTERGVRVVQTSSGEYL